MTKLATLQNQQNELFELQSLQLQQIEQTIAQKERDAILNMISLREKAAIMKVTEFEKEQAEKREVKA